MDRINRFGADRQPANLHPLRSAVPTGPVPLAAPGPRLRSRTRVPWSGDAKNEDPSREGRRRRAVAPEPLEGRPNPLCLHKT